MGTKPFPTTMTPNSLVVSPEIAVLLLAGSVDSATATSIGTGTNIVTGKKVFNGSAVADDWSGVFPISVPVNTSHTVIKVKGCPALASGTGTTNENVGYGTIVINWATGAVNGQLTYRQGDLIAQTLTDYLVGTLTSETDTLVSVSVDTSGLTSTTRGQLVASITDRTISELPMYPRVATENQIVQYEIIHYKAALASGYSGYAGFTSYPTVSTLPTSDQLVATSYRLTGYDTNNNAPPGIYQRTDSGWTCLCAHAVWEFDGTLAEPYADSWSGAVAQVLIPNVPYRARIGAAVSSIALTMQEQGSVRLHGYNPTGYSLPAAPTSCYGLGATSIANAFLGLAAANERWELFLERNGSLYAGNCVNVATA